MINPISSSDLSHFPVMLEEVIKVCNPKKGGVFIDCTFAEGYSKQFLKYPNTKVIALDRDNLILKISVKKKTPRKILFIIKNLVN